MPRKKQRYLVFDTMIERVLADRAPEAPPITSGRILIRAMREKFPDVEPFIVVGFTQSEAIEGFEATIASRRLRAIRIKVSFQGKVLLVRRYLHFGKEWGDFWNEWESLGTDEDRQHVIDLADACLDERLGQERGPQRGTSGDLGQIRLLRRFVKALQQGAYVQEELDGTKAVLMPKRRKSG